LTGDDLPPARVRAAQAPQRAPPRPPAWGSRGCAEPPMPR